MTEAEEVNSQGEWDDFTRTLLGEPTTEEKLAEDAKIRNLADANEILNYANTKKKLELPTLGYHVEYCPLRMQDEIEINQITDDNPEVQRDRRNRKKAYLILNRADKRWTENTIDELASMIIDAILMEYDSAEDGRFLLPIIRRRSDGLRRTLTPRNSS